MNVFWWIGVATSSLLLLRLSKWAFDKFLRSNSLKKYNHESKSQEAKGAWAVVTGSTDGIGLGYAQELAKKNFNVILMSRSQEKLEKVRKELQDQFSAVRFVTYVSDAADASNERIDEIVKFLGGFNVTVLVNNVGVANQENEDLTAMKPDELERMIVINTVYPAKLTRAMIPMLKENKPSLIINVASVASYLCPPMLSVYAGTKAFNRVFSNSLGAELQNEGVDVNCITPAYVSTAMSGNMRPSTSVTTPQKLAKASLNQASLRETSPYWAHSLIQNVTSWMPRSMLEPQMYKTVLDLRERALRKKARREAEAKAKSK